MSNLLPHAMVKLINIILLMSFAMLNLFLLKEERKVQ